MSLNYQLTNIKDWKNVCLYDAGVNEKGEPLSQLNPITQSLIFICIPIGMGEITEKNAEDFFLRVMLWERAFGSFMTARDKTSGEIKDRPITLDDVKAHIGLKVNVITDTWSMFARRLRESVRDKIQRGLIK